jgi:hypothetical protein
MVGKMSKLRCYQRPRQGIVISLRPYCKRAPGQAAPSTLSVTTGGIVNENARKRGVQSVAFLVRCINGNIPTTVA